MSSREENESVQEFFNSYVETALWSSTDESTDSGGEPLDENFDADDIDKKTLDEMMKDCKNFIEENDSDIDGEYGRAGHDFWLTRNRHGAGFWDGDWPEPEAKRLTSAAHDYGSFDLYVGDDGKIYGS